MTSNYSEGSLSLSGTVAMGTGVMIGAGIFALTGQVAEFAGGLFPLAFLLAAIVSGFSAYSYIKVSNKYPSAGGIAMILHRAFGPSTVTGGAALLMALSMIINESLVARTFGTYTLQLFGIEGGVLVPVLAVGLILAAFAINVAGNDVIGGVSKVTAILKIGGILIFAIVALWAAGFSFQPAENGIAEGSSAGGFLAGTALAILAYKGFTTITNSGDEVKDPNRNVGRAIMISLAICTVVYLLVCFAVGSTLSVPEIISAKDYALAEAARPALGNYGLWFTVAIAIIATASGLLASLFAVSRMLAMLTEMNLIPHSHFGMPGTIQRHTLVYTVVLGSQPDRLTRRDLLSGDGHDHPLGRLTPPAKGRWCGTCHPRDSFGAGCSRPGGVPDPEMAGRSNDHSYCNWRHGDRVRLRTILPSSLAKPKV